LNPTSSPKHIPELDGLRGLAIFLVLVWHYSAFIHVPAHTAAAYAVGALSLTWSGVDLFFVLSGFLIGGILLDNRFATNYFKVFYARRFFRILPLYFAIISVGQIAGVHRSDVVMLPWYVYATFTQTIWTLLTGRVDYWLGVTWSLGVEEQFYLLLPLTIFLLPRKYLPVLLLSLIGVAPLVRIAMLAQGQEIPVIHSQLFCRMDVLLLGVLSAYLMRQQQARQWIVRHRRLLCWGLAACAGLLTVMIAKSWNLSSWQMTIFGYSILAVAYTLLLLVVVAGAPIARLMNLAPLRRLGVISYGVYLLHGLVPWYAFKFFGQTPNIDSWGAGLFLLFSICLVFVLAHLSWEYFEKPLVELGHVLKYDRGTAVAATPVPAE
jgi:peptidoglycan/LPS O-acetylase OafA/YrhL